MVSSHELGIEVESQSHENNKDTPVLPESQPPSSQKQNFKSYEKEKTVEPCAPTEDSGQDDVIFSGKVEIISKEQFVSNIAQTIPSLEKIQHDSKIPGYPTEAEAFLDNNIWNLKLKKESVKPTDNLPKSEHSFFKMVQSLLYPANPVQHFWENVMFESISLVSYHVIAPKPYVALTSNLTNPLGLERGAVEYLASCLMAFCAEAVCGLMVCSDDWRTSSVKGALSLIEISENLSEVKSLVEPVRLHTNNYICNLLNKSFLSSESFDPTVPPRFEIARLWVLDLGDAWVAKRGLGLSDEVTLTVPSRFRSSECHVGSNREVKGCVANKAPWELGTILDSKLLSFKWQEAVSDILSASTHSDPLTTWE
ncbi:hypothetical protein O181_005942 [Austropuccinia psidii MF-1]|uniref:Uncharacterized protein n=1 Tax=Austropuccinia psidii MF-1 TaxID=1389203 RepID=A0A9Q3GH52_9BASI|nr:hypothetical protein [Austropuccinia psidii MF-1]